MTDHNQDRAKAAIKELQQQLHDASDAVQRLKRDIPSEHFPQAYEMSRTIRDLRKTIAQLSAQLNDETMELDIDFSLFDQRLDCSESSASLC
jgi:chromosome segregation ATPase